MLREIGFHFGPGSFLYPLRYVDARTGKWTRARYLAERQEIATRFENSQIVGKPEVLRGAGGALDPWR